MEMDISRHKTFQKWAKDLDGVLTLSDLKVLLGDRSEAALFKRIKALESTKSLLKVKRGLYATPAAKLATISHRIDPQAYISTGTVLAQHAVIGSIPARRVQAVKTGRPRVYQCELGVIEHLSIHPRLHFGFRSANGMRVATLEKAFLDVCYYHYRGKRFSFDPATDITLDDMNRSVIEDYLARYDARFVDFFNQTWRGQWPTRKTP
jgi:hypothetical protein